MAFYISNAEPVAITLPRVSPADTDEEIFSALAVFASIKKPVMVHPEQLRQATDFYFEPVQRLYAEVEDRIDRMVATMKYLWLHYEAGGSAQERSQRKFAFALYVRQVCGAYNAYSRSVGRLLEEIKAMPAAMAPFLGDGEGTSTPEN